MSVLHSIRRIRATLLAAALAVAAVAPQGRAQAQDPPETEAPAAEPAPPPAEVPAVLPDADAAPAEVAPVDDGIDLAAMGLDPQSAGTTDEALKIYGFADFSVMAWFYDEHDFRQAFLEARRSFAVGNFNLYLSKQIAPRWSMLGEVRFLYEPNGSLDPASVSGRASTAVPDHANLERLVSWGGINIERIHLDYEAHPRLTIRVGQWLTPYGIWNVDHGSPTLISLTAPFVIGDALFPNRQTGFLLFGKQFRGGLELGYYLGLSNGRGPVDAYRDLDTNKAVTARLELGSNSFGAWRVGASYYKGRFTDRTLDVLVLGETRSTTSQVLAQYDEQSFGADLSWDYRKLLFRGELLYHERAFSDGGRPVAPSGVGLQPDDRNYGFYATGGYRLPWFNTLAFFEYQWYSLAVDYRSVLLTTFSAISTGFKIRPTPATVIKLVYTDARFSGNTGFSGNLTGLQFQLAWVF